MTVEPNTGIVFITKLELLENLVSKFSTSLKSLQLLEKEVTELGSKNAFHLAIHETDAIRLIDLKDKIEDLKKTNAALKKVQEKKAQEPFIVISSIDETVHDHILNLATFENYDSWKSRIEKENNTATIPFFMTKVSDLWNKIPQDVRNGIDQAIYLAWKKGNPTAADELNKGQKLREQLGFTDPLIRQALIHYCQQKQISTDRRVSYALTHKLEDILACPIAAEPVSDLSQFDPCGHSIGENNLNMIKDSTCPTCRHKYTKVISNSVARDVYALFNKNVNQN